MLLDFFCIFSTGGLILWCKQFVNCKIEALINYLIKTILLDQKRNQDSLLINGTILRWKVCDDKDLIFVTGYQETFPILYVDKLLALVIDDFFKNEYDKLKIKETVLLDNHPYTPKFMGLLSEWESDCNKILDGKKTAKEADKLFKPDKNQKKSQSQVKVPANGNEEPIRTKSNDPEPIRSSVSGSSKLNPNIPKSAQLRKSQSNSQAVVKEDKPNKKGKEKTVKNTIGSYSVKVENELNM